MVTVPDCFLGKKKLFITLQEDCVGMFFRSLFCSGNSDESCRVQLLQEKAEADGKTYQRSHSSRSGKMITAMLLLAHFISFFYILLTDCTLFIAHFLTVKLNFLDSFS